MFYYVYLLKTNNGKTYVGCTNNLVERISRHNKGVCKSNKRQVARKINMLFRV